LFFLIEPLRHRGRREELIVLEEDKKNRNEVAENMITTKDAKGLGRPSAATKRVGL